MFALSANHIYVDPFLYSISGRVWTGSTVFLLAFVCTA